MGYPDQGLSVLLAARCRLAVESQVGPMRRRVLNLIVVRSPRAWSSTQRQLGPVCSMDSVETTSMTADSGRSGKSRPRRTSSRSLGGFIGAARVWSAVRVLTAVASGE